MSIGFIIHVCVIIFATTEVFPLHDNCSHIIYVRTFIVFKIGAASNEYYFGYYENFFPNGTVSVILTTTGSQSVNYSIQIPGIGYSNDGNIVPNAQSIITLPNGVKVSSYDDENKGVFLLTSSDQVTVVGQMLRRGGSDTFLILPVTKLFAAEYLYYGMSVESPLTGPLSAILIVGIKSNTTLNLTVSQQVTISVGGVVSNLTVGRSYSFVVNRLQTIFIASVNDMTGTKIITSDPVSVITGHQCANVPADVRFCDYLIEQTPPTILWGKVYYVTSLATRSRSTIKVLAAYDSTDVNVYCDNAKTSSYSLNQGKFFSYIIGQVNCAIYASKEVLAAQFDHGFTDDDSPVGDPMMMLVPPTNQYFDSVVVSTIQSSSYDLHFVNIIVLAQYYQPDMMYLFMGGVNTSLSSQEWIPIIVNNVSEAYVTQVNVQEGVVKISHNDTNALMTTMVYGFAQGESYGHPGRFYDITGMHIVLHELTIKLVLILTACVQYTI